MHWFENLGVLYNDAYAKNDYSWMYTLYKKLFKVNILIVCIILFLVLISPVVYKIWIGNSVQMPFLVSVLVGIYMIMLSFANLHAAILNGMGIIKIQIIQALIQGVIYIPLVYMLADRLSLYGILISMLLVATIPAIILSVQVNLILKQKAKGIWIK